MTVLDRVDLTQALSDEDYEKRLEKLQLRLHKLAWAMHAQKKMRS